MTITDYERELDKAKSELEDIQTNIQTLATRESELTKVVQGWQAIIAFERKQSGESDVPASQLETDPLNVGSLGDTEEEEEEGENKTQFVRDYIHSHANVGTRPDDLKKAAKLAGLRHPTSWPYGPLQRLKKRGHIVKRRGRYYPAPKQEAARQPLALVG